MYVLLFWLLSFWVLLGIAVCPEVPAEYHGGLPLQPWVLWPLLPAWQRGRRCWRQKTHRYTGLCDDYVWCKRSMWWLCLVQEVCVMIMSGARDLCDDYVWCKRSMRWLCLVQEVYVMIMSGARGLCDDYVWCKRSMWWVCLVQELCTSHCGTKFVQRVCGKVI